MSQLGIEFVCEQLRRVQPTQDGIRALVHFYDEKVREYELQITNSGVPLLQIGAKEFHEQKHRYAREALRPEIARIQERINTGDPHYNAKRLGVL
jgi:hypothetical protein